MKPNFKPEPPCDCSSRRFFKLCLLILTLSSLSSYPTFAYDINDEFSINLLGLGIYQYGFFENNIDENGIDTGSLGRGTFGSSIEFDYHPNESNNLFIRWQFHAGNALNNIWQGPLPPIGHNLDNDLRNINGRRRDYLVEAWYQHIFEFHDSWSLAMTGGIIDGTVYIDDNAYGNDEVLQFMNNQFVNDSILVTPSYDYGGALELTAGPVALSFVSIFTRTNDEDNHSFQYHALQFRYTSQTSLGEGNYRLVAFTTDKRFTDSRETELESLRGIGITVDQQLGEQMGMFLRSYTQSNKASIDYGWDISGGLSLSGQLWNRPDDEIGIAYGYLAGGNSDIVYSTVFEAYAKFSLCESANITLDIQSMRDELRNAPARTAIIPGVRFVFTY